MLDISSVLERIDKFEEIMRQFYRRDLVNAANVSVAEAVDGFNAWISERSEQLETKQSELEEFLKRIRELEARVDTMDETLQEERWTPATSDSIDEYNALVKESNDLVREHGRLAKEHNNKEDQYNQEVKEFNRNHEKRKAEVEAIRQGAKGKVKAYQQWLRKDGPQQFSNQLNALYSELAQAARNGGSDNIAECTDRLRSIRRELAEHVKVQQDRMDGGINIVRVVLCDLEECYMMVDSGASVTSVTPEMVDVLGIAEHVGEEIEIALPNAIRIKAPQSCIPRIVVEESGASFVKAVVLKASMPGVDGCLGLSFLNRFDYAISKEGLTLEPVKMPDEESRFDVFVCHKSEDIQIAKDVFENLMANGYRPFLSALSMAECHTTDYQKAIDVALEGAEHLVLVCSSRHNVETPWVEAEWRCFENLKRSGKKQGNIVPILCGDMETHELPLALSRYHVVSIAEPSWTTILIDYLPRERG